MPLRVEAVRVDHERSCADEQVAEPSTGADARVPVMGGVGGGQRAANLGLAGEENTRPRHEDVVEDHHAGGLTVAGRERGRPLTGAPGRPGHNRHTFCVNRHRGADGEVGVLRRHRAARHDEELVYVRCGGDDRLGAAQHDAVRAAFADVHVHVRVRLGARAQRAVALGVGHRYTEGEIALLHVAQGRTDNPCGPARSCSALKQAASITPKSSSLNTEARPSGQ